MTARSVLAFAVACAPLLASAWTPQGYYYPSGHVTFNLGDACDTTRFPSTPGTCAGGPADPDWRVEFATAVERWNAASALVRVTTDPSAAASNPGSCSSADPNSLFFLPTACGTAWGSTTLALARTNYYTTSSEAFHSDIIFNSSKIWSAYDGSQSGNSAVDFRRVAVHEAGHVLGLGHPSHSSAIMYFSVQDLITPQPDDLNGLKSLYGILSALAVPDLNANGTPDLVVTRSGNDGSINAEVRDGSSGALLRTMAFLNNTFAPVHCAVLPDLDGNGAPELAVLAARRSDDRGVVEIRNLSGSQLPRVIWFGAGLSPRRVAVLSDADANSVPELAVLAVRASDDRAAVEIRNAYGPEQPATLWFSQFTSPLDLKTVTDADGNGIPEVAVLLLRYDGRGLVEIKNAAGATNTRQVWAMAGVAPRALATVADADANGVPEVAILSRRSSDGRIVAEVKNAAGATNPTSLWFSSPHAPLAVAGLADADGNGVPEVAVLSRRTTDGRIVVEVKNAAGATAPRALWLSPGLDPGPGVIALDDVDGNGAPEVGVLLSRWTDGRLVIEQRNAGGPQAARQVWMSPSP